MVSFFRIFALRPTLTTITSLQKAIVQQNQILDQMVQKIETIKTAKNNYLAINASSRDQLDRLVPNDTALPSLIEELRAVARSYDASISGLQFESLDLDGKPTTLIKTPAEKEILFTLNMKGSYTNLSQFIDSLTKIDRVITIESVTMRGTTDDQISMSINAKAHYFKHQ